MPQQASKVSSKVRCIRILTLCCIFTYSSISLIFSTLSYLELQGNLDNISPTVTNWKTSTISDIQLSITGSCPNGYESPYSYSWPGTKFGCDCRASSKSSFVSLGLFLNSCNSTHLSENCLQISPNDPVLLKNYGILGSDQKMICIKRTNETWASIGPTQGSTCSSGIKCGTSDENIFCTSESQCPISSISIVTSSCADCLQIGANEYLKLSRGEDTLPLAEFRLNQYGMCNQPDKITLNPSRNYFPLLNTNGVYCNKEGDALWNQIDTIDEQTLFAANSLTTTIAALAPFQYYPSGKTGLNYNYGLYTRSYVPWKISCRGSMKDVIEQVSNFDNLKKAHFIMLIVSAASFVALGIIMTITEILNLCGCDIICLSGRDEVERAKILRSRRIIVYFFKFLQVPFQGYSIFLLIKMIQVISNAANESCSSTHMSSLFSEAEDSLKSSFRSDVINLACVVGFVLLHFFNNRSHDFHWKKDAESNMKVKVHDIAEVYDYENELNITPAAMLQDMFKNTIHSNAAGAQAQIIYEKGKAVLKNGDIGSAQVSTRQLVQHPQHVVIKIDQKNRIY